MRHQAPPGIYQIHQQQTTKSTIGTPLRSMSRTHGDHMAYWEKQHAVSSSAKSMAHPEGLKVQNSKNTYFEWYYFHTIFMKSKIKGQIITSWNHPYFVSQLRMSMSFSCFGLLGPSQMKVEISSKDYLICDLLVYTKVFFSFFLIKNFSNTAFSHFT